MTKTETTTILDIWTSGDELQVINNLLRRYVDEGLTTANGFDLFYLMSRILAEEDLRISYYKEAIKLAFKESKCPMCNEATDFFTRPVEEEKGYVSSYYFCPICGYEC